MNVKSSFKVFFSDGKSRSTVFYAKLALFLSHFTLVAISYFYYNFQRSLFQIFSCYAAAVIAELILNKVTNRYNDRILDRVLSSLAEAAGLLVLIRSQLEYYYIIAAIVAVASKYFILSRDGRHLYNPTNFAIIVSLALMPEYTLYLAPDEFTFSFYPILHVLTFGIFAATLGRTISTSISYILCGFIVALLAANHLGMGNFVDIIGPEIGATSLIFIFLMITDPAVAPRSKRGQVLFGAVLFLVNFYLRYEEAVFSHYLALFFVSVLLAIYKFLIPPIAKNESLGRVPQLSPAPKACDVKTSN